VSKNKKIAKIDKNGKLIGVREGRVVLTAIAADGRRENVRIVIAKPVTKVRTPLKTVHIKKGSKFALPLCADSVNPVTGKKDTSAKLTFKSSNKKIATVSASGKVTAKKRGTVKITVKALNGTKTTVKIKVAAKAKEVYKVVVRKAPKSLAKGKTYQLGVKVTPTSATNPKVGFKSSNGKIVKVDKAGKLTALKKGKATITVKAGSKSAKVNIKVG
jgi:uncharacterized protein YjdB